MMKTWQCLLSNRSIRLGVAGAWIIAIAGLLAYYDSSRVGFLGDDWWFLGKAASLSLPDYLAFYFDPAQQIFWYRPLYGLLVLFEYALFRASPEGYHLVQVLLHLTNSILLFTVVGRVSKQWRLGFLAGLSYVVLPVYNSAVLWIAVQDPLAMFFFLGAILVWHIYLQTEKRILYWMALGMYVAALLSKETSFFLPLIFVLLDWWSGVPKRSTQDLFGRYGPIMLLLSLYLMVEKQVQANGYFVRQWGYGFGPQVLENGLRYLALLAAPWELNPPDNYFWLIAVLVILVVVSITRRARFVWWLVILMLLAIAPAVAFPPIFFYARYLYAAAMITAILGAAGLEALGTRVSIYPVGRAVFSIIAVSFILLCSMRTAGAASAAVEYGRQARAPLREIYQKHPSFAPGTYLYFIEPPYPMIMRNLTGMFLLRYGSQVTVWSNDVEWGGRDTDRVADWRRYPHTLVYYFDEERHPIQVAVNPFATSIVLPSLPAEFDSSIYLEGYELTDTTLHHGDTLVLLLYWRSSAPIEKDYTIFIHLLDAKGDGVLNQDSQPRQGRLPTAQWTPGKLVVDAHILLISPDIPPGKYRLELGLYHFPSMTRLAILDDRGHPTTDRIVIESFEVKD